MGLLVPKMSGQLKEEVTLQVELLLIVEYVPVRSWKGRMIVSRV